MNCDKLTGRMRDICRGHDDSGNQVLTPELCEQYRELWRKDKQHISFNDKCLHRGPLLKIVKCELCGSRDKKVPVHSCKIHGTCVPKKYKYTKSPHHTCLSCEDRSVNPFDRVYCINLDRRPDRWERFQANLPKDWPFPPVERVSALDGKKVKHPAWWKAGGGAWGCYRTHLSLIEKCLNEGVESVLLLEDDALFPEDFTTKVQEFLKHVPNDWGMLYFGGQHLFAKKHPPKKINDHVYQPYNVNRTHAFALRGKTMLKVYRHLCRADWVDAQHIDHHLGRLHQLREDPIYVPREWLVGQAEGQSNISGKRPPDRFWEAAEVLESKRPEKQDFIAIIGLHSSGSSLLAGILHHLGFHLGNKLGGYHNVDNTGNKGYEAIGLVNICEQAIPFPSTEYKLPQHKIERRFRRWINEKRWEAQRKNTVAVGKYPQLCQLYEPLKVVCGEKLKIVHIDRPIEESIASLIKRFPHRDPERLRKHQEWLWEGKQRYLEHDHYTVQYHDLLTDPRSTIRGLTKWLGVDTDIEKAVSIVRT